jgi:alkylation response protein AidB-like acyl-CoA dehydrogenase
MMDFHDSPQEAAFRAEARAWLRSNAPKHELASNEPYDEAKLVARGRSWQRCKADGGYAAILWPPELGGRGGTAIEEVIFAEEEGRYHIPTGPFIGIGLQMAVPTVMAHGTPEQVARLASPTLRGEYTWCQLFSEPGAGSDLAGVRTRAIRDNDGWIVNGQKVWSSWAHHADWAILLARTDPTIPKHRGLTFFVLDMRTAGIEVRPIRQISGKSDFNETFLTDVRIPDTNRIGPIGGGWKCAMTTLMSERVGSGTDMGDGLALSTLIEMARSIPRDGRSSLEDASVRRKISRWYAQEQGLKYFGARLLTQVSKGRPLGAEAALAKLVYASKLQEMACFAMELQEFAGVFAAPLNSPQANVFNAYFWSAAMRIAGGADEILRNQIAERILDLPGEIRADRDVPFDQLPAAR